MTRICGRCAARATPSRSWMVVPAALAIGALTIAATPPPAVRANPVPDEAAREMNERPGRWLARPTAAEERDLIQQFGAYGISRGLLSPATLELVERSFDRFAPLFVAAQRPPHAPNQTLQRWYREHADPAQAEAMKRSLRTWLVAKVTEAPRQGGMFTSGPPEAVAREILGARLAAASALGEWQDQGALPGLRALHRTLPGRDPVIVEAIRRIEDPTRGDVLVRAGDGRIEVRRPFSELDSIVVLSRDEITNETSTWRADRVGAHRIWKSLAQGREWNARRPSRAPEIGSFNPRRLTMYFADGPVASLEGWGADWTFEQSGRLDHRLRLENEALTTTLIREQQRAGVAPASPRFVEESVTLSIDPGLLRVDGYYLFEGVPPDGWMPLRYPIATHEGLGPPAIEAVELRSHPGGGPLPVHFEREGEVFRIALTPGKEQSYQLEVRYRQALTGRSAKYLITTAREWGRPLHRAWFQVIMDSTLGEPRFGMPFREVGERPGFRRFLLQASPFRPDQDLVVSW